MANFFEKFLDLGRDEWGRLTHTLQDKPLSVFLGGADKLGSELWGEAPNQIEDLLKGNLEHGKQIWSGIKDNPERVFIGAVDPFSSQMWSGITGKEYDPLVNQLGGATPEQLDDMEAKGYNMDVIRPAYKAADTIAGILGAYYGGQALAGHMGGGAQGSSAFDSSGFNQSMFNQPYDPYATSLTGQGYNPTLFSQPYNAYQPIMSSSGYSMTPQAAPLFDAYGFEATGTDPFGVEYIDLDPYGFDGADPFDPTEYSGYKPQGGNWMDNLEELNKQMQEQQEEERQDSLSPILIQRPQITPYDVQSNGIDVADILAHQPQSIFSRY